MKKTALTLTFCLALLSAVAQPVRQARPDGHRIHTIRAAEQMAMQQNPYRLTRMYTDDSYEVQRFSYDENDRLVAVADSVNADIDSYFVIDSMHYNDKGQLVKYAGWQYFSGVPRNVYYIDYTYDEQGNLASRTNYNSFGGSWELGGVYTYTYNENHQLLTSELTMSFGLIQRVERTYRDGKLLKELWHGYDYDLGRLYPNEVHWYSYNSLGQLVLERDSMSDNGTSWAFSSTRTYSYDAGGNCVLYEATDYTGEVAERSEYRYDLSIFLTDVTMPAYPEMERPKSYQNVNALSTESWWTLDVNHQLQYVCDYNYEYNGHAVGIRQAAATQLTVSPNPASGRVAVEGLPDAPTAVRLLDAAGRTVMTVRLSDASNILDVSFLHPGLYLLSVEGRQPVKLVVE